MANTAGTEQRSKYQNELTKKKRIGDKSGVSKFQLSLRAQCELQSRFVASTEAFCSLVLRGKFRLRQKYLGFNPDTQEISGLTDQWTDEIDLLG